MIERLRLLWSNRRFIAKAALAGLIFGVILALLLPKRYESSTRLMPPDNQSGSSGLAMLAAMSAKTGVLASAAGDLLGMKSTGAVFVGILGSQTVADRLVEKFNLKKVYSVRLEEDARRTLAENTSIVEDRKSGIIMITVSDRSPERAAAIAQAYIGELDQLAAELSTSAARRERIFLEDRLKSVKLELDEATKEFSQFASKNTTIDIKEQGKAMMDAAATLMGQLIAAESQLKGLEEIYSSNNVRVRSVQARITELHHQLDKLGGKSVGDANESAASGDSLYPSIRKLPLLGVAYGDLYRRTKIQEAVYESLTQEYELVKVQEAKETPSVKVLDVASVPERKSSPRRVVVTLLCVFFGMVGGAVWVLGKARWVETDPQDPGKLFAQEVFQTVNAGMPWAPPNGSRIQAMTHRVWVRLVPRGDSTKEGE